LLCGTASLRTLFSATDRLYGTTSTRYYVVECAECGMPRLFPRPHPAELAKFYPPAYYFQPADSAAGRLAEIYRRFVLLDHVAFVEQALRRAAAGDWVLDVGCSGGLMARLLRDRGWRAVGFDNSLDAARTAWVSNFVPVVCGDFLAAPLPNQSFGVVTMFHLLEHVEQPRDFLAAAHRILKPGGRLIVQVPNAASWQALLLGEAWNGFDVPRHLWNFRAGDLDRLLESAGFQILRRKDFSWRDNPAGLATSLAPALDPMARRVRGRGAAASGAMAPLAHAMMDVAYLLLTAASVPFALLEAACRAGSTVMVEAAPRH
jgi:SAM-dependent methyltransferase